MRHERRVACQPRMDLPARVAGATLPAVAALAAEAAASTAQPARAAFAAAPTAPLAVAVSVASAAVATSRPTLPAGHPPGVAAPTGAAGHLVLQQRQHRHGRHPGARLFS